MILFREDYPASDGKEIFLSFENKNRTQLYSLLRLRIPNPENEFLPELKNSAIIREIHTYGQLTQIGKKGLASQHKGLGKTLMKEAERIAKGFGLRKMTVISGVGVRGYYRKQGYKLKNSYMIKQL